MEDRDSIRESYTTGEIDIADYHHLCPAWTQSTDELLPYEADADGVSSKVEQDGPATADIPSKPPVQRRDTNQRPVSIHVELHDQLNQGNGEHWGQPLHRIQQRHSSPSDSAGRKGSEVCPYGIELENLSPPSPIGAQSTDQISHVRGRTQHGQGATPGRPSRRCESPRKRIPDYKPTPLRWPFQLFLLCLIAGLIAYVEYQLRHLPSHHRKVLNNFNLLDEHLRDAGAALLVPTAQPLLKSSSVATATSTWVTLNPTTMNPFPKPGILVAAPNPTPEPSPRPPQSEFPNPRVATTYCGWTAPQWTMMRLMQEKDGMQQQSFALFEYFSFFSTDDSSWCPCEIGLLEAWDGTWGQDGWKTNDKGCEEVMSLMVMMNSYKEKNVLLTRSPITNGAGPPSPPMTHWTFTTPPLPTSGFWQYPQTDANGAVLLPLEIRTVTADTRDAFGDPITAGGTALFPEAYRSKYITYGIINPCWDSAYLFSPRPSWAGPYLGPPCTEKPTIYPTVWWTLPLSRPTPRTAEPPQSTPITSTSASTNIQTETAVLNPSNSNAPPSAPANSSPMPDIATPTTSTRAQVTSPSPLVASQTNNASSPSSTQTIQPLPLAPSPFPPPQPQPITIIIPGFTTQTKTTVLNSLITISHSAITTHTRSPTDLPQAPPRPHHPPGPIPPDVQGAFFNLRTEADYLMASLIPVLLATLLSIPIGVFISSINNMLPFRAMVLSGDCGARAEDSVCLPRDGGNMVFSGPATSVRFLTRFKDPLPLISLFLNLLSTVLVPLSSEIIRMEFSAMNCPGMAGICAFSMRKSTGPMRAAEGILVGMGVLVVGMGVLLGRWRTGVATEPWSIAAVCGLVGDGERKRNGYGIGEVLRGVPVFVNGRFMRDGEMERALEGWRFKLGYCGEGGSCGLGHGIVVVREVVEDDTTVPRLRVRDPPKRKAVSILPRGMWGGLDRERRELSVRVLALVLTAGLLILILYYEATVLDTPLERFMDSQSFGVRVLFTAFGTAVSTYWDYYFAQVSEYQLHQRLSSKAQPARTSILLSPPSYIFVGLWRSFRTNDYLSLNVALAALFAKFTPILFSDIPYRNTVTWKMHEACTWMAVIILSYMVLVLLASLPVWDQFAGLMSTCRGRRRRRSLPCYTPVRLDTVAGCVYYLCDSKMLKDFEGTSLMGRKERDKLVSGMGRRYVFGDVSGVSGVRRVGVDYYLDQPGASYITGTKDGWR